MRTLMTILWAIAGIVSLCFLASGIFSTVPNANMAKAGFLGLTVSIATLLALTEDYD